MSAPKYTVETVGPRIKQFLSRVLEDAGFDLRFTVGEGQHVAADLEDPEVTVEFTGRDTELLLANKAELLLAIEHLTMEMLHMPGEDHSRLCFDANDYRVNRMEELRLSALTAAERVKKSRIPFHFSPMSSRERRIIHLSLRNEPEVRSESTGTGPIRQVVIVPAEMKTVPEPVRPKYVPSSPGGPAGRKPGRPAPRRGPRR